jgi:SAM-dependent methyltransferase
VVLASIESIEYRYVRFDYSNPSVDFPDAHPFCEDSFDCVFSYAVLEHLHSPFLTIKDIERVLKPGGLFIGTASQEEPSHAFYIYHIAWVS